MILTIRTDKPDSELGLYDGPRKVAYETWQAHRQLAETIHRKLEDVLADNQQTKDGLSGIVVYQGPGSFTGLRIGMSVANALSYSLDIPITTKTGDDWISEGVQELQTNPSKRPVLPEYGSPAAVTTQKK